MTPTQRTLARLRKEGWSPWIIEKWNPFAHIRQDGWGFIDIIALRGNESLYIQCTDNTSVSKRVQKIIEHDNFPKVKAESRKVQVWGWARGDREPRIVEL